MFLIAIVIRIPEVLAGANEAVLANWLVEEGTEIAVGDVLAEIETEKATVEYESEEAGTLAKVLIAAGDSADVGSPIAVFSAPGDSESDVNQALESVGAVPSGSDSNAETSPGSEQPSDIELTGVTAMDQTVVQSEQTTPSGRIFVSPLVRKLARERDIDLTKLSGSGPGGRIVRKDFDRYLLEDESQVAKKPDGDSLSQLSESVSE